MSKQENYHTVRYGTAEGEIKFGHITQDNQTSACDVEKWSCIKSLHYFRPNW